VPVSATWWVTLRNRRLRWTIPSAECTARGMAMLVAWRGEQRMIQEGVESTSSVLSSLGVVVF
jgi:hypothetical protein